MPIEIKKSLNPREIEDIHRLRYEVYVKEIGYNLKKYVCHLLYQKQEKCLKSPIGI